MTKEPEVNYSHFLFCSLLTQSSLINKLTRSLPEREREPEKGEDGIGGGILSHTQSQPDTFMYKLISFPHFFVSSHDLTRNRRFLNVITERVNTYFVSVSRDEV